MRVKCNKTKECDVAGKCTHAVPHEKVLMCDPGICVFLNDKAECLPLDVEER